MTFHYVSESHKFYMEFDWPLVDGTTNTKAIFTNCGRLKTDVSVYSYRPFFTCASGNTTMLKLTISFAPKTKESASASWVCTVSAHLKNFTKIFIGSSMLGSTSKPYSVDYQVDCSLLRRIHIDIRKVLNHSFQTQHNFYQRKRTFELKTPNVSPTNNVETKEAKNRKYPQFRPYEAVYYKSEKYADVTINVQGNKFPAHGLILAAVSPVFETMLSRNFMENVAKEVQINNFTSATVSTMVQFMYTGDKPQFESNICVQELYAAADYYDIEMLKKLCQCELSSTLNEANAFDILLLAVKHSDDELKKDTLAFIYKNLLSVFDSKEAMDIAKKRPELLKDILDYK